MYMILFYTCSPLPPPFPSPSKYGAVHITISTALLLFLQDVASSASREA